MKRLWGITTLALVAWIAGCSSSSPAGMDQEPDIEGIWWVEIYDEGDPEAGAPSAAGWVELMELHAADGDGRICENGQRLRFHLDAGWTYPRLRMTWRDFWEAGEFWDNPVDREEVVDVYWEEEGRLSGTYAGGETVVVLLREQRWPSEDSWCS